MTYKEIIQRVATELDMPYDEVDRTYKAFWQYVRDSIESLPLKEDLTKEEFDQLKTNFNIPSIGKLSCTYDRYVNIKKKFNYIKRERDNGITAMAE